jgi:hypothetical protein
VARPWRLWCGCADSFDDGLPPSSNSGGRKGSHKDCKHNTGHISMDGRRIGAGNQNSFKFTQSHKIASQQTHLPPIGVGVVRRCPAVPRRAGPGQEASNAAAGVCPRVASVAANTPVCSRRLATGRMSSANMDRLRRAQSCWPALLSRPVGGVNKYGGDFK